MNITAFYQHLDGLFAAGQIEQVEPYLLTQMVIANQEHDADASLAIINELTGFYRSQQRFEEAIRVAEQAMDLCSKEYRLGSLSHATTLLNAATAYRFAGQSQKALELFRQCQAIYEEKLSPMDEHYAGLYNNMSAAYSDLGQLDQAADCLLHAAVIMDALPAHAVESAVTHANLAALYAKQQNWPSAKAHLASACSFLKNQPQAADKLAQFQAMQELFSKYSG